MLKTDIQSQSDSYFGAVLIVINICVCKSRNVYGLVGGARSWNYHYGSGRVRVQVRVAVGVWGRVKVKWLELAGN